MRVTVRNLSRKLNALSKVNRDGKIIAEFTVPLVPPEKDNQSL